MTSSQMKPASVAYMSDNSQPTRHRAPEIAHLGLCCKARVSRATVVKPSMKENAESIPSRNRSKKSRRTLRKTKDLYQKSQPKRGFWLCRCRYVCTHQWIPPLSCHKTTGHVPVRHGDKASDRPSRHHRTYCITQYVDRAYQKQGKTRHKISPPQRHPPHGPSDPGH